MDSRCDDLERHRALENLFGVCSYRSRCHCSLMSITPREVTPTTGRALLSVLFTAREIYLRLNGVLIPFSQRIKSLGGTKKKSELPQPLNSLLKSPPARLLAIPPEYMALEARLDA